MKRSLAAILLLSLFSLAVAIAGCSKKQQASPETTAAGKSAGTRRSDGRLVLRPYRDLRELPGTVFDVTYTPSTMQIDQAHWQRSLQSISKDGRIWVFDPGEDKVKQLDAGKVLFLENLAVLKVLGATDFEGHRVLVTERAGLPDLIQHGKIAWKVPVSFSRASAGLPRAEENSVWSGLWNLPAVHADGGDTQSGEDDGWKFNVAATPGEKRLDIRFDVTKENSGLTAQLSGQGHVSEFASAASMTVDSGSTSELTFANSQLSGKFHFDWSASRGGSGDAAGIGESKIKLPTMMTMPLPIGGIPFVLSVGEQLIVQPGFGAKNEIAKGAFDISFDGGEGISIKNGEPSQKENLQADSHMGASTTVSIAPHAMLVGVCVPKVTLGLGTESGFELLDKYIPSGYADRIAEQIEQTLLSSVVKKKLKDKFKTEASAYVQVVTVFTLTSAGAVSLVPCKLQRITVTGQAGADATILGQQVGDKKMTLFEKSYAEREPDINACGEK